MKQQITADQARIRLEEMCVRAEHCEGEVREKLRKWQIVGSDAQKIVAGLKAAKFIDDQRFAEAYVRDKYRFSHWGRRKISQGLYVKKVDRAIIAEALDSIDQEEYQNILQHLVAVQLKKLGYAKDAETEDAPAALSYEDKLKVYRFALQRGFESELIARAIKYALSD